MEKERAEIIDRAKKFDRVQACMKNVNVSTLTWAFQKINQREGGRVCAEYERNLDENVSRLLVRMKKFSYFPQPAHREHTTYNKVKTQKHEFRLLEDEIVKIVFSEILGAIYDSKILGQKSPQSGSMSRCTGRRMIYLAYLCINVKALLTYIDNELLISFLEQNIADRNFIRYIRRFLDKGAMDFGKQSELEVLEMDAFAEMLCKIYLYYTLQTWTESMKSKMRGDMYVVKTKDEYRFLFHNVLVAKRVYRALLGKLEELGIRTAKDIDCVLSVWWSDKAKYLREYPQRYITRNRRKRVHS